VFTSSRDGNDEIYIMKSDGTAVIRLTNHPAVDTQPAGSFDGTRIAFSSNRDDPDPQNCGKPGKPNCIFHIYVMNVDGTGVTRVTNGPGQDTQPIWSPNNQRLAFASNSEDAKLKTCGQTGQPPCVNHLYTINVDGSGLSRLTNNPPSSPNATNGEPTWSPDGSRIAFASDRDGNGEVYAMNADGSGVVRLTNDPAADGHPSWSPDGRQLVFESNRDKHFQLYVMNADGSGVRRLTNTDSLTLVRATNAPPDDRYPVWIPGCNDRIVFASNRDGGLLRIFAVDPDGSNLTRLTTLPSGSTAIDTLPSWSGLPEPLREPGACCVLGLAFDSLRDGNEEIYIMRHDGSRLTRLTFLPARDMQPAPSPDGLRIAFASNREGRFRIFVMNVDGSGAVRLSSGPGDDTNPVWSNDNRRIAFVSTRDDPNPDSCGQAGKPACVSQIYVMNADGSGVARVTTNPPGNPTAANGSPNWSMDSKRIAFQSNRDGNDEVYVMNADGSGVTRLTNNPASDGHPAFSADGQRIAFESNRDGRFQIYAMKADGSGQTRLTNDPGNDRYPYWCPSCADRIAFQSNRDGVNYSIYVMNGDGSNQVRLTRQPAGVTAADEFPAWSGVPLIFLGP
jgi:Tol biopolymer transport system component